MTDRSATQGPDWQPIETAPKDGRTVLGWWEKSQTLSPIYWDGTEWFDCSDQSNISSPSHWMNIPKPPNWRESNGPIGPSTERTTTSGAKIVEGLRQAVVGDLALVTIDGQVWQRIYPPLPESPTTEKIP